MLLSLITNGRASALELHPLNPPKAAQSGTSSERVPVTFTPRAWIVIKTLAGSAEKAKLFVNVLAHEALPPWPLRKSDAVAAELAAYMRENSLVLVNGQC